jgi:hypothetical protein
VSDDAHKPRISTAIRAAIAKPLKFYFVVPSVDLMNWLVVEAGNPEQPPQAQSRSSATTNTSTMKMRRKRSRGAAMTLLVLWVSLEWR